MRKRLFFVGVSILLISLLLNGCGSPGGGNDHPDQNLQGKIANQDFQFVSGYATTNFIELTQWTIRLYKINPMGGLDPWAGGAYTGSYPYLSFTISKSAPAQEYAIQTLGPMQLYGWADMSSGVIFDSGTLTITEINLTGMTISGYISANTNEHTSSLLGKFTIPINPN